MSIADRISRALSGDELGIRTARHDETVLRSAYQLVFRPVGDALHAFAAEGLLRPFSEGTPLEPRAYLASLNAEERMYVDCLGAALHLANHSHIGIDNLDHLLVVRHADAMNFAEVLAPLMHDVGMETSRLIGTIRDPSGFDDATLRAFATRFRALGGHVAIGTAGQPTLRTIRAVMPDIVSIGGFWFRRVAEDMVALRLLRNFVEALKTQDMQVLIEGVETQAQLLAALYVGADFISGYFLSRPQLVGTDLPEPVIPMASLLSDGARVVPLFGSTRGNNQGS